MPSLKNLFVCNIPFSAEESHIRGLFMDGGYVPRSIKICTDRETGKSRGFAFVEVDEDEGDNAIADLNGEELLGRKIVVRVAEERHAEKAQSRYVGRGR